MTIPRSSRLFAPWPKRIALSCYALLIILTIASGAVEFRWGSGTPRSPSSTSIGIESGRVVFTHGAQAWRQSFVDLNYDGWKWWIKFETIVLPPRQTFIAVPLWMLLVLFGALGAALPAIRYLRGHCRHCEYDLRGHPPSSQICPECGRRVKPQSVTSKT